MVQRGDKKQNQIPMEKAERLHSTDKNRPHFQCNMKKDERSSRDAGRLAELLD